MDYFCKRNTPVSIYIFDIAISVCACCMRRILIQHITISVMFQLITFKCDRFTVAFSLIDKSEENVLCNSVSFRLIQNRYGRDGI